jgi:hypothetical protein
MKILLEGLTCADVLQICGGVGSVPADWLVKTLLNTDSSFMRRQLGYMPSI